MKVVVVLLLPLAVMVINTRSVSAVCKCEIEVASKITIDGKEAVFLPGTEVNIKMKELAGDDLSTSSRPHMFSNQSITSIIKSETEPTDENKEEKNIVSTSNSLYPIYMWYDNGTIYWWSEDDTPSLNQDASFMFYRINNLGDISGIENYDSSGVKNLRVTFAYVNLNNYLAFSKWNTSNVEILEGTFSFSSSTATDISGFEKWDVSKVEYMNSLFSHCNKIESLEPLANWDTSSAVTLANMFNSASSLNGCGNLTDLSVLMNWDVSNVEDFSYLFTGCNQIVNLDLSKWNTTNMIYMTYMFGGVPNLEELDISSFDTKKVTSFYRAFSYSTKLKHIYVGENWDTSANTEDTTQVFPTTSELPNFSIENENYKDLSYAHTGEGGYLTLKTN